MTTGRVRRIKVTFLAPQMCIFNIWVLCLFASLLSTNWTGSKSKDKWDSRDKTTEERWGYGDPLFPDRSCITTSDPETCCWVEVTQRWREQKQPEGKGRGCMGRRSKRKRLSDRALASSSVFAVVSCLHSCIMHSSLQKCTLYISGNIQATMVLFLRCGICNCRGTVIGFYSRPQSDAQKTKQNEGWRWRVRKSGDVYLRSLKMKLVDGLRSCGQWGIVLAYF